MYVHVSGFRKTVTLPSYIFDDDSVSLGAKGLFVQLFYSNDRICSLNDLTSYTTSSEDELKLLFAELSDAGYILLSKNKCELRHKAHVTRNSVKPEKAEIEKYTETIQPKKKSMYQNLVDTINRYELPPNVKALLITYFTDWLNRKGRFADASPITNTKIMHNVGELVSYHLSEPDMISCIQQSIDKGWFKFVSSNQTTSQFDKTKLTSCSYTVDDIENIKRRAEEADANGEKGTF